MEPSHWAQDLALRATKRVGVTWDRVWPAPGGLVVLLYHRVGRHTSARVDLPSWLFAEQMARLAATQRVVDLGAALRGLGELRRVAGPDPVALTFDDGTPDLVDEVLPVLVEHRLPVTVYVATNFVERQRPFPDGGGPISWSGLADALSTGLVTIGSHTDTHALLDRLEPSKVAGELDRSVELIGERLGVVARHFAYPKAVLGTEAAQLAVRSRFVSAALAGTRPNPYRATNPYRLARSPVQVDDGLRYFARKADGGMRLEDDVRRLVNRYRYASATS